MMSLDAGYVDGQNNDSLAGVAGGCGKTCQPNKWEAGRGWQR